MHYVPLLDDVHVSHTLVIATGTQSNLGILKTSHVLLKFQYITIIEGVSKSTDGRDISITGDRQVSLHIGLLPMANKKYILC